MLSNLVAKWCHLDRDPLAGGRAPPPRALPRGIISGSVAGGYFFKVVETFCLLLCLPGRALCSSYGGIRGIVAMSLRAPCRNAFNCLVLRRRFTSAATRNSQTRGQIVAVEENGAAALSPRWLSDLKRRIGRCISFGLTPEQVRRAGNVLHVVGREWKDLVAGSEGFLTGPGRAGLERHRVVWGDMDSMVCTFSDRAGIGIETLKRLEGVLIFG